MTPNTPFINRILRGDLSIIFYLSLLKLGLHLAVNATGGYGLFRDELYYIACSKELAAGYVDHPPLSVYILRLTTTMFGDSLFAVRLFSAITSAASTFMIGLIAIRIGGNRLAAMAACALSFSPIYLAMGGFYSMNSIDILIWIVVAYIMVRIVQGADRTWWIWLGITLGLGLLNKIGVLFLGAGLFAGLLLTKERRWLLTPWPYAAGVIAFALFLPYIIWNFQNSFAHLEFIHNASTQKYSSQSASTFLSGQLLLNNPMSIVLWLPGIIALFKSKQLKQYSILAWMFIIPLLIFLINGTSKPEYLSPAFGVLFAAGSVFWSERVSVGLVWKYAFGIVMILWMLLALATLPVVLPVMPVEKYISYSNTIGLKPESSEGKELSELPQFYADTFGWKEKAEGVALAFRSLSEEERAKCAIFSNNYGRCAAIDYYGKNFGLPRAIGSHNNYWIWGLRGFTGEVLIILGGRMEDHRADFASVELVTVVKCTYCMPYENNVSVFIGRGLKQPPEKVFNDEKNFE